MTAALSPLPVPGPVPSACVDADEMEAREREDRRREDAALAHDVLAEMRASHAAPEAGPFAGWIGVVVPADEPGAKPIRRGGLSAVSATPGKILLLVPPDLLAALRNGQAT